MTISTTESSQQTDIPPSLLRTSGQIVLFILEGIVLLLVIYAFWHNITQRQLWFWMLWLAVPFFALRLRLSGYLWTHTRLHDLMIVFVLVAAFNYAHSPISRESFMAAFARPLSGMWLCVYLIEITRASRSLLPVLTLTLGMSATLAGIALTASQWLEEKSSALWFIIERLPRFDYRVFSAQWQGEAWSGWVELVHSSRCYNPADLLQYSFISFNVNEIAGALSLMTPFAIALSVLLAMRYADNTDTEQHNESIGNGWLIVSGVAGVIGILLLLALLLGQSRFAIGGVIGSLLVVLWLGIRNMRWKIISVSVLGVLVLVQAGILFNVFTPSEPTSDSSEVGINERDSESLLNRFAIWESAGKMIADYPATGAGMYMFRTAVSNPSLPYEIPYYVENELFPPPHAHNAWINMGAEMGIPGLLVYIALQAVIVWMLWVGWRNGDAVIQVTALATFAGLLGYAAYSIGDTVALWDRFQFTQWWLIGVAGAQYVLAKLHADTY
ncbi:MAG: O-antigen ligase family protein [Chloroflexota bacterium]